VIRIAKSRTDAATNDRCQSLTILGRCKAPPRWRGIGKLRIEDHVNCAGCQLQFITEWSLTLRTFSSTYNTLWRHVVKDNRPCFFGMRNKKFYDSSVACLSVFFTHAIARRYASAELAMALCSPPYVKVGVVGYMIIINCGSSIVLTATDEQPRKSLKRWYYPPSNRLNINVMLSNIVKNR